MSFVDITKVSLPPQPDQHQPKRPPPNTHRNKHNTVPIPPQFLTSSAQQQTKTKNIPTFRNSMNNNNNTSSPPQSARGDILMTYCGGPPHVLLPKTIATTTTNIRHHHRHRPSAGIALGLASSQHVHLDNILPSSSSPPLLDESNPNVDDAFHYLIYKLPVFRTALEKLHKRHRDMVAKKDNEVQKLYTKNVELERRVKELEDQVATSTRQLEVFTVLLRDGKDDEGDKMQRIMNRSSTDEGVTVDDHDK
eukprot:PhF_6_TR12269/c0_g1_i2/m.19444